MTLVLVFGLNEPGIFYPFGYFWICTKSIFSHVTMMVQLSFIVACSKVMWIFLGLRERDHRGASAHV